MKKETQYIIKNIDFHDLTVSNLNIDLKEKKVSLTFDEYDELGDDYFPMTLTFDKVSQFLIDHPLDVSIEFDTLLKADFKELANNDMADFTFSMGFSKPVCTLIIHFTSLTVKRTLSSTAIDFKKANLESRYEKMEWFEKNNLPVPEWV
jgi:hypothetical protein